MSIERKSKTMKMLERINGRPLTLGGLIESIRIGEEQSQAEFARRLKISRSHLNDIEKGNKAVSPERAARFARILRFSAASFVELAIQSELDRVGLKFKVEIKTA